MQIRLAVEQSGVQLPHGAMQCMMRVYLDSEAEYAHSMSVALQLPLEQTLEFLMAGGFFVRV